MCYCANVIESRKGRPFLHELCDAKFFTVDSAQVNCIEGWDAGETVRGDDHG